MAKTELIILARERVEVEHNGTPHKVWRVEYEATDGNQGTAVARTVPGGDGPHMVELKETQFGEFTEAITFPGLEEQQRATTTALTKTHKEIESSIDALTLDKLKANGVVPENTQPTNAEYFLSFCRSTGLDPLRGEVEMFMGGGKPCPLIRSTGWQRIANRSGEFITRRTFFDGIPAREYTGTDPVNCTVELHLNRGGQTVIVEKTIKISEWVMPNNPNWRNRLFHMAELRAFCHACRDAWDLGQTIDEFDAAILEAEDIGYTDISGLLSASTAEEVSAWVQANPAAAKANRAEVAKKRKEVRG